MKNKTYGQICAFAAALTIVAAPAASSLVQPFGTVQPYSISASAASSVAISASEGFAESLYVEWADIKADGYHVYVDGVQLDDMLIRRYGDTIRADAVGLKAGSHTVKVVPVSGKAEQAAGAAETKITTTAYDRSGYGWMNGTSSGAYNEDGTLKANAVVVYVTEATKDSVEAEMTVDNKGNVSKVTGFQNILTQLKKGTDSRPFCFRLIGNIKTPSTNDKGDIMIDCGGKYSAGITVEGIGNDATCNGFGIRVKNCTNVEIRNLGFMNCNSDEGDNVGLQQDNDHVWVHNCDMFYGDAGSDADQVKGDGALDCKKSTYITFSYNHFWDNGKCNLLGLSENTNDGLYITYHHNWYDHSDSRHPRCRYYTAHVYNNYYDGNAKYGIGSTTGSSVLSENNYFRNCKYPYLTSMQGTDYTQMLADGKKEGTLSGEDGGTIKSYGDYVEGAKAVVWYQDDNKEFDAYKAESLLEEVPSSVVSKSSDTLTAAGYKFGKGSGSHTYNNVTEGFIKDGTYKYSVDKTEDVPSVVSAKAGRLQGGDFKWTFTADVDAEYAVDTQLKAALVAYQGSVDAIGGFSGDAEGTEQPSETQPAETETTPSETEVQPTETEVQPTETEVQPTESQEPSETTVTPSGTGYIHNFTKSGTVSDFYTITGNTANNKGKVTYNDEELTVALKMESATSVKFTAPSDGLLTLVFMPQTDAVTFNLDGKTQSAELQSDGSYIASVKVTAGAHEITKKVTANLAYIAYSTDGSGTEDPTEDTSEQTPSAEKGDINASGNVSVEDIVSLTHWLGGRKDKNVSVTLERADMNGDGVVNIYDLILLKKLLLK